VRAKRIAAFQAGEADIFLISLKAGGTGINLTAADYVIHLDPWWNPAVEDQATDRAHRIGQTRPVTVYRLIARGTIEEQILRLHGDKRALVAGVLDGTGAAARLTTGELLQLLAAVHTPAGDDETDDAERQAMA
jgi:SNF2 family DNA or RNA helicase